VRFSAVLRRSIDRCVFVCLFDATHCAPASKALLIKSVCVIRIRTSGETRMDAMAAVALCIVSSLMWPCSQSMTIP
jgi:hypothetical protein